jgi:hypothetical protein
VADDAAEVIAQVFDEAQRHDPTNSRTWVALVDGNNHQIDRIEAEAAARGITLTTVVDLIHVLEPPGPLRARPLTTALQWGPKPAALALLRAPALAPTSWPPRALSTGRGVRCLSARCPGPLTVGPHVRALGLSFSLATSPVRSTNCG